MSEKDEVQTLNLKGQTPFREKAALLKQAKIQAS